MDASVLHSLVRFQRASGFQELADCSMELIGNPMVLFDVNENIVACTDVPVADQYFTELQVDRKTSRDLSKDLNWIRSIRRIYSQPRAAFEEFHGLQLLTRGLLVNGIAVGHLQASAYFRPFTDDDLTVVDLIAPRLALELYQHLSVDSAQRTATDTFLHYLLSGHTLSPETLQVKTSLLGWQPGKVLYVLCVNLLASSCDLQTIVSSLLCGPDDRYTSYDNHAVMILSLAHPMTDEERVQIALYFSTLHAACGISRPFGSLAGLAGAYEQATAACDIGARLWPSQFLYDYDACLPYVFVRRVSQTEDVLRYCMPDLLEFAAEDSHASGGLMQTLYCYLTCGRSVKAAAERLGVHKNTVTFRLGKIADVLGLDWSDPACVRRLMHSISILEYVDRERYFGPALPSPAETR